MNEAEERRVQSPCVSVCVVDDETGLCEGCLRTLDEVAVWGSSTSEQRREILAAIERRRAEHPSLGFDQSPGTPSRRGAASKSSPGAPTSRTGP